MALIQRDERPATEPMFSPYGVPYYQAWRAAIYCWAKDPARRPSMEEVARMLKPIPPPVEEPERVPEHVVSRETELLTQASSVSLQNWDLVDEDEEARSGLGSDSEADPDEEDEAAYCYCGVVADGDVVECDSSSECTLRWVSAFPFVAHIRN